MMLRSVSRLAARAGGRLLLLALAAGVAMPAYAAAFSPQSDAIAQVLVQVTDEEGAPVPSQAVTVEVLQDARVVDEIRGTTADDGAVLFRDVAATAGRSVRATVLYEDVPYRGEPVPLQAGGSVVLPVTVLETTDDASTLHIDILHVVLTAMAPGEYHAIQVMQVLNVGARASLGGPSFEGRRAGLIIPLPTGATNIAPLPAEISNLEPSALVIEGNRLLHLRPVPPGAQQVAIEYQLSTGQDGRDVELTVPYPTSRVNLLIGPGVDGVAVVSDRLVEEAPEEIEGQGVYANWASDVLAGGATLRFRLGPPGLHISVAAWSLIALGTALLASVAASLWGGSMASDDTRRRRLIDEIAVLDKALDSGEISKPEHHSRRATALEMISQIDRQASRGGHGAAA